MKDGERIPLYVSAVMYSMYLTHYIHVDITLADATYATRCDNHTHYD
jgi:hypothetical protein